MMTTEVGGPFTVAGGTATTLGSVYICPDIDYGTAGPVACVTKTGDYMMRARVMAKAPELYDAVCVLMGRLALLAEEGVIEGGEVDGMLWDVVEVMAYMRGEIAIEMPPKG